jgi:hypothetical protein
MRFSKHNVALVALLAASLASAVSIPVLAGASPLNSATKRSGVAHQSLADGRTQSGERPVATPTPKMRAAPALGRAPDPIRTGECDG